MQICVKRHQKQQGKKGKLFFKQFICTFIKQYHSEFGSKLVKINRLELSAVTYFMTMRANKPKVPYVIMTFALNAV